MSRDSFLGSTHIWKGGDPAWAIWLVKPLAMPNRKPTQAGELEGKVTALPRSTQSRCSPNSTEIAPSTPSTATSDTCAANSQPSAMPTAAPGSITFKIPPSQLRR